MVNKPTEPVRNERFSKEPAILTMCASGLGTSIAFQAMIEQELSHHNITGVQVLAVSLSDIRDKSPQYQSICSQFHLLACVGNMEIPLDIPFFHISSLISSTGKEYFIDFLNSSLTEHENIPLLEDVQETVQDECQKFLSKSVMYLNPAASIQYSEQFLKALNLPQINANRECHLALLLHLGFMVERCICEKRVLFDNETEFIENNQNLFKLLKKHISILTDPFNISVNDAELCYIILTLVQYPKQIDN